MKTQTTDQAVQILRMMFALFVGGLLFVALITTLFCLFL